ncbi:Probable apyrase 3, partial [Linum perenne]
MLRDTEIRLMATAGMRLLESDVQGKVMEGCRNVLREYGFLFMDEWASVISGSDEGVYAWIVANYASGCLEANLPRPRVSSSLGELQLR